MMLPFSIQCSTCSSFMYRGRKFNSKKEAMKGPDGRYLGIQRFRFYIKCTVCSRPVTFLTDPKNADYEMESGATRNYEVHKDREKTGEEVALEKENEEKSDPMKALENRVLDSQREMADLDNLDEIKAMNMRHVQLMSGKGVVSGSGGFDESAKALLDVREAANKAQNEKIDEEVNENGLTASEEAMVKSIKFGSAFKGQKAPDKQTIQRLGEDDEDEFERRRRKDEELLEKQQRELSMKIKLAAKTKEDNKSARRPAFIPVIRGKRKRVATAAASKKPKAVPTPTTTSNSDSDGSGGALGGLLGAYGSDSDSD